MTRQEAEATIFTFGKYMGQTVEEVSMNDMQYCEWLHNNQGPRDYNRRIIRAVGIVIGAEEADEK